SYMGFETGWSPLPYLRILGSYTRGRDKGDLRIGNPEDFFSEKQEYSLTKVGADWDTLDDAQFPSKGARVSFNYNMY
ncbi:hypothetical protein, partial [Salmonella enterica]